MVGTTRHGMVDCSYDECRWIRYDLVHDDVSINNNTHNTGLGKTNACTQIKKEIEHWTNH
jgi:hypothetical protein